MQQGNVEVFLNSIKCISAAALDFINFENGDKVLLYLNHYMLDLNHYKFIHSLALALIHQKIRQEIIENFSMATWC